MFPMVARFSRTALAMPTSASLSAGGVIDAWFRAQPHPLPEQRVATYSLGVHHEAAGTVHGAAIHVVANGLFANICWSLPRETVLRTTLEFWVISQGTESLDFRG